MNSGILIVIIIALVCVLIYAIKGLISVSGPSKLSSEQMTALNNNLARARSDESREKLAALLLEHLKLRLQCPGTGKLCSADELFVTGPNEKGKFKVRGYIDSQNGFGAMKRANFNATARFVPEMDDWCIDSLWVTEN